MTKQKKKKKKKNQTKSQLRQIQKQNWEQTGRTKGAKPKNTQDTMSTRRKTWAAKQGWGTDVKTQKWHEPTKKNTALYTPGREDWWETGEKYMNHEDKSYKIKLRTMTAGHSRSVGLLTVIKGRTKCYFVLCWFAVFTNCTPGSGCFAMIL